MRNDSFVPQTLDILIRQSLAALAPDELQDDDLRRRFEMAFDAIGRFYRSTRSARCESFLESGAVTVRFDQRSIRCPRLLVQCMKSATSRARALTIAYVPDEIDKIALDIMHSDANYRTSQYLQWTALDGWCSPGARPLSDESHAEVVREALYESGLFAPASMTLEPLDMAGEVHP